MLILGIAGCVTKYIPTPAYLDKNADSLYSLNYVLGDMDGFTERVGYKSISIDILNNEFSENTIRAGLVLPAKSILTYSNKIRAVYGNDTTQCMFLFTKSINYTRKGRSALTSVMNLTSTLKGEEIDKQDEPDTTISSIISEGVIMLDEEVAGFYFKRNYNFNQKNLCNGWLVLHGDTLIAKYVKNQRGEASKTKKSRREYEPWLELEKNGTTIAAFSLLQATRMSLYMLKSLSEKEIKQVTLYMSIIVFKS